MTLEALKHMIEDSNKERDLITIKIVPPAMHSEGDVIHNLSHSNDTRLAYIKEENVFVLTNVKNIIETTLEKINRDKGEQYQKSKENDKPLQKMLKKLTELRDKQIDLSYEIIRRADELSRAEYDKIEAQKAKKA